MKKKQMRRHKSVSGGIDFTLEVMKWSGDFPGLDPKCVQQSEELYELGRKHGLIYAGQIFDIAASKKQYRKILDHEHGHNSLLFAILETAVNYALAAGKPKDEALKYGDGFTVAALDKIIEATEWKMPGLVVVDVSTLTGADLYDYKRQMGTNTEEDDLEDFARHADAGDYDDQPTPDKEREPNECERSC